MTDYTDAYNIAKICAISVAKRYGLEFDDCISEGYLAVASKISKFDPTKSSIQTYITTVVTRELIDSLRKRKVRSRVAIVDPTSEGFDVAESCGFSDDDDVTTVARLALRLAEESGRLHKKTVRNQVRMHLVSEGWSKARIEDAFDQLACA